MRLLLLIVTALCGLHEAWGQATPYVSESVTVLRASGSNETATAVLRVRGFTCLICC